ncbi:MAG: polyprenyl diphosphate synthase [Patescibacteria group bacterium]|nr:polyprenyl diphosphate synthase [Patescibacteria group bacterium]
MNKLTHIAIIPDGNRRWAKKKRIPSFFGHREGAKTAEKILEAAVNSGIPYFTFWGCSVGNVLKRPKMEKVFLFRLFEEYFKRLAKDKMIHERKVKIRVLGRWEEFFPEKAKRAIKEAMEATKNYKNFNLTFLLAYSGMDEMKEAIKKIAKLKIIDATIKNNLWTKDLPPVDLVVRTGGEANWSHWSEGFMMWDTANAQFYFTETLWPDFSEKEFKKTVEKFRGVERRLGK